MLAQFGYNEEIENDFRKFAKDHWYPARVASEHRNLYVIYSDKGESLAEVSGKFWNSTHYKYLFPKVGDFVAVTFHNNGERAIIHAVLPRKNKLMRQMPSSGALEAQILAANIDLLIFVSSLDLEFNIQRIERYITFIKQNVMDAIIVLNKSDLADINEKVENVINLVGDRYPVLVISAKTGNNVHSLKEYLKPRETIAIVGSSGVGKSSIINSLIGDKVRYTGEIRFKDGRGKHHTTSRDLVLLENGSMIIDNPGMRQIAFWTETKSMSGSFEDIEQLMKQCYFRNCSHNEEPGCAVIEAIENGTLDPKRYNNYLKQKREVDYMLKKKARKDNMKFRRDEKRSRVGNSGRRRNQRKGNYAY